MSVAAAPPSQWETRDFGAECRADVDDKTIVGWPIMFRSLSVDLGGFKERIMPAAVDRTLREGLDVRMYHDHSTARVLGRTSAGTLSLKKEARGLKAMNRPDTSQQWIRDLMKSIARGDVTGMSFRFRVMPDGDEWQLQDDGTFIRDIHDMVIGEVSIVSEPAYPETSVALRSMQAAQAAIKRGPSIAWRERRIRAGVR